MKNRGQIEHAWSVHMQRPFPRQCAGQEIDGVCLTSCDTYLAGCVSHVINGGVLDADRRHAVASVCADIERVLPHLSGEAREYFAALLSLGATLDIGANAR